MNQEIRREMSLLGYFLIALCIVSSVCILLGSGIDMISALSWHTKTYGFVKLQDAYNYLEAILRQNGTGYLIAAFAIWLLIRMVKGKEFTYRSIFQKNEPLPCSLFVWYLALYLALAFGSNWIREFVHYFVAYGRFGTFSEPSLVTTDSMFFYAFLVGPLTEEILFRGLALRTLAKSNRSFAVLAAALMAAFYQQDPALFLPAFLMGIVLGCVTLQYNIIWSMLLHVSGELLFRDSLFRIVGPNSAELVSACIYLIGILLVLLIGIWKRKVIAKTIKDVFLGEIQPIRSGKAWYLFFTSFGVIVYFLFLSISSVF